jgi:hypothetical protein
MGLEITGSCLSQSYAMDIQQMMEHLLVGMDEMDVKQAANL